MSQTKAQLIDNLVQPITGALGSASAPTFSFTLDPNTGLYSPGADQLALSTGGTGRLFIDSNGRVGVGVAALSQAFTVRAASGGTTARFENTSSGNFIDFQEVTGGTRMGYIGHVNATDMYVHNDKAGPLIFDTNNLERLRITSAGLVGIGTSSASTNVEINAALDTGVSLGLNEGQLSIGREANSGGAVRIGYDTTNNFGFISSGRVGTSWDRLILNAGGGNVGIGTTNPGALLHVANKIRFGSNASYYAEIDHDAGSTGANIYNSWDTGGHIFQRNGNEQLRINGAGEVGINTSSPLSKLGIAYTATGGQSDGIRLSDTTNTTVSVLGTTGSSYSYAGVTGHNTLLYGSRDLAICADNANNGIIKFMTGGAERARINSLGMVGISTSVKYDGNNVSLAVAGAFPTTPVEIQQNTTTTHYCITFRNANGLVGNITTTGSATAFNTSSDYRLKENVVAVTDGIIRLQQLKPNRFNFITDPNKTVDGFIAHEVQAVVPEAITGTKDAVDDKGNPVYQGIDQSKLVPLLTAALQEAVAKIESLEARLTAAGI